MESKKDFSFEENLPLKRLYGRPPSPPEGKAAQVEHPRYPVFLFLKVRILIKHSPKGYYIFMD
jgi:hypothetical protein